MVFHTHTFPSLTLSLLTGTPGGPTSRRRKDQGFLGASHILKPDGGLKVKKAEKVIVKEFTYDNEKHLIFAYLLSSSYQPNLVFTTKENQSDFSHLYSHPIHIIIDPTLILYFLHRSR